MRSCGALHVYPLSSLVRRGLVVLVVLLLQYCKLLSLIECSVCISVGCGSGCWATTVWSVDRTFNGLHRNLQ